MAEVGAGRAATPADAIAAGDVVIVCLLDYPSVDDVLRPAADGLGGRVVVNVTNGVPAQARDTGAWVTGAGAEYVDGSSVRLAVRCPRILGWCCGAIVGS